MVPFLTEEGEEARIKRDEYAIPVSLGNPECHLWFSEGLTDKLTKPFYDGVQIGTNTFFPGKIYEPVQITASYLALQWNMLCLFPCGPHGGKAP